MRALAGMVHFLGLVQPELTGLDRLAWTIYADDHHNLPISKRFEAGHRFKRSFTRKEPVRIHFVGVWETVSAFGWMWELRTVPFTASNPSIDHVRHAVAIDERRTAFQPNLFRAAKAEQHLSFQELWFAGSHGDVGGGYPEAVGGCRRLHCSGCSRKLLATVACSIICWSMSFWASVANAPSLTSWRQRMARPLAFGMRWNLCRVASGIRWLSPNVVDGSGRISIVLGSFAHSRIPPIGVRETR